MTSHPSPDEPATSGGPESIREEAARYALMRRIAPALRHHMAGTLQPIGMISAILDRRLQAPEPDMTVLRENSKSISTLSRSAASACMNLITWVAPKENGVIAVQAGIEECVGMLATDLAFRGFTVSNQVAAAEATAPVIALRTVFTAALIALTDAAPAPASIVLSSEAVDGHTRVLITVSSAADATASSGPRQYRQLDWDDVNALAAAEKISLSHDSTRAEMRFPVPQTDDLIA
jgi:hypothetical protein